MTGRRPAVAKPPLRLPSGTRARYVALALLASVAGTVALVPHMPHPLSALLIIVFIGVGPGCAALAWVGPPSVSRLFVVPALGLAGLITLTGAAATVGWWAPRGIFVIVALITIWSTIPHLPTLVRDMVR